MSSKTFHYPPYNRFTPWREDADYRVAVVSPVGNGPKGDPGDSLTYADLTDEDKLDLANALITSGIEKGDPGFSAFEVAQQAGYQGTVEQWLQDSENGIKGPMGDFSQMSEDDKDDIADRITDGRIDDRLNAKLPDIGAGIAANAINLIYPVGSLYFTMADNTPAQLGFPGNWVQLDDRFLYATTDEAGVEGGTSGSVMLADNQVPLRSHSHGHGTLEHNHLHNEGADTIVRPFKIRETAHKQRQTAVGSSNATITSFTKQSTPAKEGWGSNDGYDGRAIIFNSLRRNTDSASTAKASPVKTGGPIAYTTSPAGTGTTQTKLTGGSTAAASLSATEPVNIMPPYITVHVWRRIADTPTNSSNDSSSEGSGETEGEATYTFPEGTGDESQE